MTEILAITALGAEHLRQLRELYCQANWIDAGEAAEFLVPAIAGSTVAAGVFENGELIGFGRALSDGCSDAYIQDVIVRQDCRKRGIGSQIIRFLEAELRRKGVDWIGLVGEPGTENFYSRLGLNKQPGYTLWKLEND